MLPVILVPLVAVFFALRQERLYEASADVLVKNRNLSATLSGVPEVYEDPVRVLQTQVELATTPEVARRVLRAAGVSNQAPASFLARSGVISKAGSDVLTFRVTDGDARFAARLANEYARQFTRYRYELATAALRRAKGELEERIAELGTPARRSPLFATWTELVLRREQLVTLQNLEEAGASLIRPAAGGTQIQPRPIRAGGLGLGLGLLFGMGLAFLWQALDTRIRSAEEIGQRLGLPLLGRIPEPPRHLRRKGQVAMLAAPRSLHAEAFRMLRTNLEFANLERRARTIMFTSAVEQEGKSTTVVNLAVAMARAGQRVAVVDLDLRRPFIDRMFDLNGHPGVTDIALGRSSLDDALAPVSIADSDGEQVVTTNGNQPIAIGGALTVLSAGPIPPDPGEFMATQRVSDILSRLRERFDVILIDAPPLLHVGDAMTLSAKVDGLVLVTRLNVVRRSMLSELSRLLETCPVHRLGFVLTGATLEDVYGYEGYYMPKAYEPSGSETSASARPQR